MQQPSGTRTVAEIKNIIANLDVDDDQEIQERFRTFFHSLERSRRPEVLRNDEDIDTIGVGFLYNAVGLLPDETLQLPQVWPEFLILAGLQPTAPPAAEVQQPSRTASQSDIASPQEDPVPYPAQKMRELMKELNAVNLRKFFFDLQNTDKRPLKKNGTPMFKSPSDAGSHQIKKYQEVTSQLPDETLEELDIQRQIFEMLNSQSTLKDETRNELPDEDHWIWSYVKPRLPPDAELTEADRSARWKQLAETLGIINALDRSELKTGVWRFIDSEARKKDKVDKIVVSSLNTEEMKNVTKNLSIDTLLRPDIQKLFKKQFDKMSEARKKLAYDKIRKLIKRAEQGFRPEIGKESPANQRLSTSSVQQPSTSADQPLKLRLKLQQPSSTSVQQPSTSSQPLKLRLKLQQPPTGEAIWKVAQPPTNQSLKRSKPGEERLVKKSKTVRELPAQPSQPGLTAPDSQRQNKRRTTFNSMDQDFASLPTLTRRQTRVQTRTEPTRQSARQMGKSPRTSEPSATVKEPPLQLPAELPEEAPEVTEAVDEWFDRYLKDDPNFNLNPVPDVPLEDLMDIDIQDIMDDIDQAEELLNPGQGGEGEDGDKQNPQNQ